MSDVAEPIDDIAAELECEADNEAILARIASLRSELAASEASCDRLRSSYDDIRALNVQITINCATERATKDAEIVELRAGIKKQAFSLGEAWTKQGMFLARAGAAEARIVELERLLAYGTDTSEYRRIRARAEKAEARFEISRQLEKELWSALGDALDRAEKAEARIAELKPLEHSFETILEAKCLEVSQRLISRAEKAEASHEQQVIVAANYAELAEKAEAERDAFREAMKELVAASDAYDETGPAEDRCSIAFDKARAALVKNLDVTPPVLP